MFFYYANKSIKSISKRRGDFVTGFSAWRLYNLRVALISMMCVAAFDIVDSIDQLNTWEAKVAAAPKILRDKISPFMKTLAFSELVLSISILTALVFLKEAWSNNRSDYPYSIRAVWKAWLLYFFFPFVVFVGFPYSMTFPFGVMRRDICAVGLASVMQLPSISQFWAGACGSEPELAALASYPPPKIDKELKGIRNWPGYTWCKNNQRDWDQRVFSSIWVRLASMGVGIPTQDQIDRASGGFRKSKPGILPPLLITMASTQHIAADQGFSFCTAEARSTAPSLDQKDFHMKLSRPDLTSFIHVVEGQGLPTTASPAYLVEGIGNISSSADRKGRFAANKFKSDQSFGKAKSKVQGLLRTAQRDPPGHVHSFIDSAATVHRDRAYVGHPLVQEGDARPATAHMHASAQSVDAKKGVEAIIGANHALEMQLVGQRRRFNAAAQRKEVEEKVGHVNVNDTFLRTGINTLDLAHFHPISQSADTNRLVGTIVRANQMLQKVQLGGQLTRFVSAARGSEVEGEEANGTFASSHGHLHDSLSQTGNSTLPAAQLYATAKSSGASQVVGAIVGASQALYNMRPGGQHTIFGPAAQDRDVGKKEGNVKFTGKSMSLPFLQRRHETNGTFDKGASLEDTDTIQNPHGVMAICSIYGSALALLRSTRFALIAVRSFLGLYCNLKLVTALFPAVFAVIDGIVAAAKNVKEVLPESSTTGYILITAVVAFMPPFLLLMGMVSQTLGSLCVSLGLLALSLSSAYSGYVGLLMTDTHSEKKMNRRVDEAQKQGMKAKLACLLCMIGYGIYLAIQVNAEAPEFEQLTDAIADLAADQRHLAFMIISGVIKFLMFRSMTKVVFTDLLMVSIFDSADDELQAHHGEIDEDKAELLKDWQKLHPPHKKHKKHKKHNKHQEKGEDHTEGWGEQWGDRMDTTKSTPW